MSSKDKTLVAYKGFDKNLQCRGGYQYEVGKTYEHNGPVVQCQSGFHACQNPFDVWDFYDIGGDNRFARVTLGGEVDCSDDKKWAAAKITVDAELTLPDFVSAAVKWLADKCAGSKKASGYGSQIATSGDDSKIATSGDDSKIATSGDRSKIATSGYGSQIATSGYYSKIATSGDRSKIATSGYGSKVATSGYYSKIAIEGKNSAAAAVAPNSRIKAVKGVPIAICSYNDKGVPTSFATGVVGKKGIKEGVWYKAKNGKLVECKL